MKFKLDENLPRELVDDLTRLGHERLAKLQAGSSASALLEPNLRRDLERRAAVQVPA